MAGTIENVEIFGIGTHHGSETVVVTSDDLDDMVSSFKALAEKIEGFRPHLKLGHSETQDFFGNGKGAPSFGFVDKLWRVGDKILANFKNVPEALIDLIKNRRYNAVSVEVHPKIEHKGINFRSVLTAVALIGAELPAVKGLKELGSSLFEGAKPYDFDGTPVTLTAEIVKPKEKDETMPSFTQEQLDAIVEKEVQIAVDKAKSADKAEIASLKETAEADKVSKLSAQEALRAYVKSAETKEAEGLIDKAIEQGKILPKQRDTALAFMAAMTGKIKFGDTEKPARESFKEFVELFGGKVDLTERTETDEHGKSGEKTLDNPADEVDRLTLVKLTEKKAETYQEAMHLVLAEDSELKTAYLEG